jgi:hypothetical protein
VARTIIFVVGAVIAVAALAAWVFVRWRPRTGGRRW